MDKFVGDTIARKEWTYGRRRVLDQTAKFATAQVCPYCCGNAFVVLHKHSMHGSKLRLSPLEILRDTLAKRTSNVVENVLVIKVFLHFQMKKKATSTFASCGRTNGK